jgi:hypothetical protein
VPNLSSFKLEVGLDGDITPQLKFSSSINMATIGTEAYICTPGLFAVDSYGIRGRGRLLAEMFAKACMKGFNAHNNPSKTWTEADAFIQAGDMIYCVLKPLPNVKHDPIQDKCGSSGCGGMP